MKKPKCPICEAGIHIVKRTYGSTSSNDVSLLGGYSEESFYRCKHWSQICQLSEEVYSVTTNKFLISKQLKSWRLPLELYNDYIDFCIDNDLQTRLLTHSNEYGEISNSARNMFLENAQLSRHEILKSKQLNET